MPRDIPLRIRFYLQARNCRQSREDYFWRSRPLARMRRFLKTFAAPLRGAHAFPKYQPRVSPWAIIERPLRGRLLLSNHNALVIRLRVLEFFAACRGARTLRRDLFQPSMWGETCSFRFAFTKPECQNDRRAWSLKSATAPRGNVSTTATLVRYTKWVIIQRIDVKVVPQFIPSVAENFSPEPVP